MASDDYVLRPRDREELSRLELQHRVWQQDTEEVIERAGFGAGDRIVDPGSGPGFLTFDLAQRVGPSGSVLAIDSSEHFIRHLRHRAKARGLGQIQAEVADLVQLELPESSYDGAVFRWVLMFVADPEQVVARVSRGLRSGGVMTVMEYVQFRSISLWPRGASFSRLYDAVHELIARSGGDADIGGRVPELLVGTGFEIVELVPVWRVGRPGSPLWEWLGATHANHPNLVEAGLLTRSELEAYSREWDERSGDPSALFTAPPLLATIARKR